MNMNSLRRVKSAVAVILLIFVYSCSPIENRDELTNSFSPNDIKLEVTQATPGSNKVSMKMTTPGVTGYWDYLLDQSFTDEVKNIVFPFTGKHQLTFHVTTPYMPTNDPAKTEYISKSIEVNITQLDTRLADPYYILVGQNLLGRTWVFDGTGGDNGVWWAMTDPGNAGAIWWNAGGECCPPTDAGGHMVFDVAGGLNITVYSSPTDANPKKGTYSFNGDFSKLYIKGDANILGSEEGGGNNKVFNIIELTNDKMILLVPDAAWATGWVWHFKPQN